MKIKAVCEATGLTDRAVRYYIEEGLIDPKYTENYLGRRNYDFSEEDVHALERIAKLRSYDFSVAEIRGMIRSPETIGQVCSDLIARKRAKLKEDEQILKALEKLPPDRLDSVDDLVAALEEPAAAIPADREKPKLISVIGKAAMGVLFFTPFALATLIIVSRLLEFRFPKFDLRFNSIVLACLVPSVIALFLPKKILSRGWRIAVKSILITLCAASIFVLFSYGLLCWNSGGTDKLTNYGVQDWNSGWPKNDVMFQSLFPSREVFFEEGSAPALYHYNIIHDVFDDMVEVTAERQVDAELFETETARCKLAFTTYYEQHAEDWRVYWGGYGSEGRIALKYKEFSHGRFRCCAFYTESEPFNSSFDRGTVYLFAFDPESLTLRYEYYRATAFYESPFYCDLSW